MRLTLFALIAAAGCSGDKTEPAAEANAAAEATPAPAPAPKELGLLGIRNEAGQIKTILVDKSGFKTLGNGLAIPRESGWWWLGYIGQEGWDELVLWSAPSGTTPATPAIDLSGISDAGIETVVHYVGKDYVSFELHTGGMSQGAAHPWQSHELITAKLDAPLAVNEDATFVTAGAAVDFVEFGGEAAGAALVAAGQAARAAGECLGEPSAGQWGLFRDQGAWEVRGGLSYEAEACRDSFSHYDAGVETPAALLDGYPALDPAFATWAEQVPGLLDVTASPSGNLAVLFTQDGVKLKVGDNESAKQLYTKQPTLVMAFWVSGDEADAWRSAAAAALPGGGRSRGGGGGFSIPGRKADFAKEVDASKSGKSGEAAAEPAPTPTEQ